MNTFSAVSGRCGSVKPTVVMSVTVWNTESTRLYPRIRKPMVPPTTTRVRAAIMNQTRRHGRCPSAGMRGVSRTGSAAAGKLRVRAPPLRLRKASRSVRRFRSAFRPRRPPSECRQRGWRRPSAGKSRVRPIGTNVTPAALIACSRHPPRPCPTGTVGRGPGSTSRCPRASGSSSAFLATVAARVRFAGSERSCHHQCSTGAGGRGRPLMPRVRAYSGQSSGGRRSLGCRGPQPAQAVIGSRPRSVERTVGGRPHRRLLRRIDRDPVQLRDAERIERHTTPTGSSTSSGGWWMYHQRGRPDLARRLSFWPVTGTLESS